MTAIGEQYRGRYVLAGLVALATVAVYLPSLKNDFVNWDDYYYIHNNPHIRSLNWSFITWALTEFYESNWHPLTWLSHAIDFALWGWNPLGHHLTSTVLHGVNTFLVVLLVWTLAEPAYTGPPTSGATVRATGGIAIAAGVTGLLFGLHPVHTESVAWISERKDLLCGLFFLLSVMAYARFVRARGRGVIGDAGALFLDRFYLLSLFLCLLALLSKPMAVSLPAVLLVLDVYPFERVTTWRSFRQACAEKLPFMGLSLAVAVVTVLAQRDAMWVTAPHWPMRLIGAARALTMYLFKMIMPLQLAPFYPYWDDLGHPLSLVNIVPVMVVIALTAVSILYFRRGRTAATAWVYYVLTLFPVLGIVQVGSQSMADRYTYLPGLGPFIVAGSAAAWFWTRARALAPQIRRVVLGAGAASGAVLVVMLVHLTLRQIPVWKDSVTLWSFVLEKDPERTPIAHYYRGLAFMEQGMIEKALSDFNAALSLSPAAAAVYVDRALAFKEIGDRSHAVEDLTTAIGLNPSSAEAYGQRGLVYKEMGQYEPAIEDYTAMIRISPASVAAYNNRGVAFMHLNRLEQALADYDRAIALDPSFPLSYLNRGMLRTRLGQHVAGVEDLQKACERGSGDGCDALRSLLTREQP